MCELCDEMKDKVKMGKMEVSVGDETFDVSQREGQLGFAMAYITESNPDAAVILTALGQVLGADVLSGKPPVAEFLTVRDIVGALVLLKMLAHLLDTPQVTVICFEISAGLAGLPQMSAISPPTEPAPEGRFSSVQMIDVIPKAN